MLRSIRSVRSIVASLAVACALLASSALAGDAVPAKSKGPGKAAPASVKYFHRVEVYLKPVTLTDSETKAVKALEDKAAPTIDSGDPAVSSKAKSTLHKDVLAVLTAEQRATLKTAHARKSAE